jgi:hypothetical protein
MNGVNIGASDEVMVSAWSHSAMSLALFESALSKLLVPLF